ncbi:MAG: LolA family protein [Armatimonadota bacterium]
MPPKALTAEEIIQRCVRTYGSVRSFTGRALVSSSVTMPGQPKAQMRAEARIAFVRPGKLRVDGVTSLGGRDNTYLVVSDGKRSWLKASFLPKVEETTDVSMHIAAVTGVGLQAPTTLPALLIGQSWGYPFMGTPRLLGRERVQGVECYKIRIESPVTQTTVWIDTGQFLLRRMHQKHDMKALRSRMPAPQGAGPDTIPDQMELTHEFVEQKVNQPVPGTLFRKP